MVEFERVSTVVDAQLVIKKLGWRDFHGTLFSMSGEQRSVYSGNFKDIFKVYSAYVNAETQSGIPVSACIAHIEFHGGKGLSTRVFPPTHPDMYKFMDAILYLRDHYLNIPHIEYSEDTFIPFPVELWNAAQRIVDESEYNWR